MRSLILKHQPLRDILPGDSKIIEIDPPDPYLAEWLVEGGYSNYIGLIDCPKMQRDFVTAKPRLEGFFHKLESPRQIVLNNAEALIFSGASVKYLLDPIYFRHAHHVIIRLTRQLSTLTGVPLFVYRLVGGHLQFDNYTSYLNSRGSREFLVICKVSRPTEPASRYSRYYISPEIGVMEFLNELNKKNVEYVVLRWFERLPHLGSDEDLDILVADCDFERVRQMLSKKPGLFPADVYTCSGIPGSAYHGIPYYSPGLSREILDQRVWYRDSFYVPNRECYFLSLAYHALYHKGQLSGSSRSEDHMSKASANVHDYEAQLSSLARELGIDVEITLEALHRYLVKNGWGPPTDTLNRLSVHNPWIARMTERMDNDLTDGELIVYILRRYATDHNLQNKVVDLLTWFGLAIILTKPLTAEEQYRAERWVRGGIWDKWNAEVDPGGPSYLIVAFDYNPLPLKQKSRRHPMVRNKHFFHKYEIRNYFNPDIPEDQQVNVIHSSDNEAGAWNYLEIIMPQSVAQLRANIQARREAYRTKEKVLQRLSGSHGAHSKVELIDFRGSKAVKKTYAPSHQRFLEREKFVMQNFNQECPAIPPLLEAGDNYIVYPYYEDRFKFGEQHPKVIPLRIARAGLDILRFFYEKGYAVIDFHPRNIIVDKKEGIKAIDFEYLYKYKTVPPSFNQSYDLAGVPEDFDGDRVPGARPDVTYEKFWKPYIKSPSERVKIKLRRAGNKILATVVASLRQKLGGVIRRIVYRGYAPLLRRTLHR